MLKEIKTRHEHYFVDEQGLWQGNYKKFYMSGRLFIDCFFVDNNRHGKYSAWHDDGVLWRKGFYKNGNLHGEFAEWTEKKKLRDHCFYVNGECISFDEIPLPKTDEDRMYFMLKYGLPLLPVESI